MSAQAYPLQWPKGRPRRSPASRRRARFSVSEWYANSASNSRYKRQKGISVAEAVKRVIEEADRIGARGPVISSNIELRLDGLPRSGQREPQDPGVCAYFDLAGKPRAMPCDTYDTVAGNIAAIAAHIEATRAIERHGVATVAEMFEGFAALPPPKSCWDILGVPRGAGRDAIDAAFRSKAKTAHPDLGGSAAAMAEINAAREQALGASS